MIKFRLGTMHHVLVLQNNRSLVQLFSEASLNQINLFSEISVIESSYIFFLECSKTIYICS